MNSSKKYPYLHPFKGVRKKTKISRGVHDCNTLTEILMGGGQVLQKHYIWKF